MTSDLLQYRKLFPITQSCHYLNHAAVAPTSTRVGDAVKAWVDDLTLHGMSNLWDWVRQGRDARAAGARLLGATSAARPPPRR